MGGLGVGIKAGETVDYVLDYFGADEESAEDILE